MTNEQINAAIAEACGWTEISNCTCGFKISGMPPYWAAHKKHLPDYCTDLNAMQQAINILNKDQFVDFIWELMSLEHEPMLSTASQRAEAFVRSLGKWAVTEDSSVAGEEVQG